MHKANKIYFNIDKSNLNETVYKNYCGIEKVTDKEFQSPKYSINASDDEYFLENTHNSNLLTPHCTFKSEFEFNKNTLKSCANSSPEMTPMEVDEEFYDNVEILSGDNINMEKKKTFKTLKINNKLVKVPLKDDLIAQEEVEAKETKTKPIYIYASITLAIICIIIYYLRDSLKPENIEIEASLRDKVFNQETAVNDIINVLNSGDNINILAFIGSSGVGKTYIANTLKTHFPNVFHFYGKEDLTKNVNKLNLKRSNLLIFDDLYKDDAEEVISFINKVAYRFDKKDIQTVIVLIFTIQSADENLRYEINYEQIPELISNFNNFCNYKVNIVKFKEFTQTDVEKWVLNELKSKNISGTYHKQILDNVIKGHSALYKGVKGLNAKIRLEIAKTAQ